MPCSVVLIKSFRMLKDIEVGNHLGDSDHDTVEFCIIQSRSRPGWSQGPTNAGLGCYMMHMDLGYCQNHPLGERTACRKLE